MDEAANGTMFPVGFKKPIPVAPKERLVTVSIDGKTKAYPFRLLRRSTVTTGRIRKKRFVNFFDPSAVTTMGAEQIAESRKVGAVGVFSPELELVWVAMEGPLAGRRLEPIEHGVFYAFAWLVFNPDTEVVGVATAEQDMNDLLLVAHYSATSTKPQFLQACGPSPPHCRASGFVQQSMSPTIGPESR